MAIDYKDLGKRIKTRREASGYSQAELADKVELSTQHISNIENAKSKVSLDKLLSIANVLNCTVDEIICGSMKKSRSIYIDDINAIIEQFSDIEIRALPDFLNNYHSLSDMLRQFMKENE